MTTETTDPQPGERVEWRSGRIIEGGTYRRDDRGWALIDTDAGEEMCVRPELLHPPGVLAAEDEEMADLVAASSCWPLGDDDHATLRREQRGPWCDTCKHPAVFSEFFGLMHSTAEHPFGVPKHVDDSGHEVTTGEWWRVPR